MEKIYLADDDADICKLLEIFLKNEGYDVKTFDTGDKLYEHFLKIEADVVILDIMMPGSSGLVICEKLRQISSVPIIMLTAKDTDADYVAGISLGSDDYLIKPFNPTILGMRVKALLRRVNMTRTDKDDDFECVDLKYSKKNHSISIEDRELLLTKTEFNCLKYMMEHCGESISREELLKNVWGFDNIVETRVTDETIRKIRKKIKALNGNTMIKNKWGYGYILKERE